MEEKFRTELLSNINADMDIIKQVDTILTILFKKYKIEDKSTELSLYNNDEKIVSQYIATMRLEGKSEGTVKQYRDAINQLLQDIQKNIVDITTNDIRYHLAMYQHTHKVKNNTIDNKRRYLSTFFSWLCQEEYIVKNPMLRIKRIKQYQTVKKPFDDIEIEKIRQNLTNKRDIALVEFLLSTGCRVSEIVNLNITDIDVHNRECIVRGKGNKERKVYISDKCVYYLNDYLNDLSHSHISLFVNKKGGRLSKSSIESIMRKLSLKLNFNIYPHRFRRTFATNMLNKGMPLQYVQKLLGHDSPETTMIYCHIEDNQVKFEHQKIA